MAQLDEALQRILERVRQDRFGDHNAPVVSVSDDTGVREDGTLCGEIHVRIARCNGETVLIESRSLDHVKSLSELEDTFADLLSGILAKHHTWPR